MAALRLTCSFVPYHWTSSQGRVIETPLRQQLDLGTFCVSYSMIKGIGKNLFWKRETMLNQAMKIYLISWFPFHAFTMVNVPVTLWGVCRRCVLSSVRSVTPSRSRSDDGCHGPVPYPHHLPHRLRHLVMTSISTVCDAIWKPGTATVVGVQMKFTGTTASLYGIYSGSRVYNVVNHLWTRTWFKPT